MMTQSRIAAVPANDRLAYYGHKRDSSLSTNCSIISGQSRVLPFATTSTLRPVSSQSSSSSIARKAGCKTMAVISEVSTDSESTAAVVATPTKEKVGANPKKMYFVDNPRFAMARPRRVVTQLAPGQSIPGARDKSRNSTAISISAILGDGCRTGQIKGIRGRPIIGLGLTLNPADTLVRLQPKRSATQPEADTIAKLPFSFEYSTLNAFDVADSAPTTTTGVSATARSSVVLSEAFSYKSPMLESCVSLVDIASPRDSDPQLIASKSSRAPMTSTDDAVAAQASIDSWISSPESSVDHPSVPSIKDSHTSSQVPTDTKPTKCSKAPKSGQVQKPRVVEPQVVSCLLCFELVKLVPNRAASTSCSACGTILNFSHFKACSSRQLPHWY